MFVVRNQVGRLIEGRIHGFKTREEAVQYCDRFRELIRAHPREVVICADYRPVSIFLPAATEELQRLMEEMNPRIERSAVIVAKEHPTNALQVDRVVREARFEKRRRFSDASESVRWLSAVLDDAERARLERFVAEYA